VLYEELTDPRGIRFWPEDKGRDGCRTPMPWNSNLPNAGFTTGTPWLPVKHSSVVLSAEQQDSDPDSTLNYYRRILAWRKTHPALKTGDIRFFDTAEPVLAYTRGAGNKDLVCVFNLSAEARTITVSGTDGALEPVSNNAELNGSELSLGPNGFAVVTAPAGEAKVSYEQV
jgi:alpha-glucosidase